MSLFFAQVVNGLMIGGIYALLAVAFTMIFGVLRVVYLAHGQVVMVGAYVGFFVLTYLPGRNLPLAFVAAAVVTGALGLVINRATVQPLLGHHHLMPLVSTISVGVILEELVRLNVRGGQLVDYPAKLFGSTPFQLGLVRVTPVQVFVLACSVVLMLGLTYVIRETWYGRSIRAVAQSPDIASTLGVNVRSVAARTFLISSALTGVGGVLFGLIYTSFDPYFGGTLGLKVLAAVLLGGLGSLVGAAFAGFLLGLIEALAVGYLQTSYQDAFAFGAMMLILIARPAGLFGTRARLE